MGRSTAVTIDARHGAVRVEYVKARAVLRLRRLDDAPSPAGVVELPLEALTAAFDIGPRDTGFAIRFLLFGGSAEQCRGGARDLLGVFDDEQEARAAFHERRALTAGHGGWAEILAVEQQGPLRRLCWFGAASSTALPPLDRGPVRRLFRRR